MGGDLFFNALPPKVEGKKRASLSRDISGHEGLTNFSSAPFERADDLLGCRLPTFGKISEMMLLKRFLKGVKPILKIDVFRNQTFRK